MKYNRMLVVEDELVSAFALEVIVRPLNFNEIIFKQSGEDAIAYLQKNDVDIISMDIELEGKLSGLEAAKKISEFKEVPIIFVTSHDENEYIQKIRTSSAFGYISKPFRAVEVRANIELAIYKFKEKTINRQNQFRLQMATDVAKISTWEYNLLTKKISFSDRLKETYGFHEMDVKNGMRLFWKHIVPAHEIGSVSEKINIMLKGETDEFNLIHRIYKKNNDLVWVHNRCRILEKDPTGKPIKVYGVLVDLSDRIALEEEVIRSERRYQAIIQDQTELICRFDKEGLITFKNKAFEESIRIVHGIQNAENILDLFSSYNREKFKKHLLQLTPEKPVRSREYKVQKTGKMYAWQMWNNRAIFDHNGEIQEYQSVGRDITKEKQAESALKLSEKQYRSVVDNQTELIFRFGLDGMIIFANDAILKLLKKDLFSIMGTNLKDLFSRSSLLTSLNSFLNNNDKKEMHATTEHCFEGEIHIIQWIFNVVHDEYDLIREFQAVGRDVTEQKLAEKKLQRLTKAIEQADESIMITDKNGIIEYVNPAYEKISGFEAKEVIGKSPSILKSGKHEELFYQNLWQTIRDGQTWKGTFINRKKNGSLYEELATISPVYDENKYITNFVAVKRNITEQRQLEKQLRQAQKMEAIGTLAGGIAHDFNNLLSVIFGYTELAIADAKHDENIQSELQEVLTASQRARELVQQILAFSRQKETEAKPLILAPIVKETVNMLRSMLPSTILIHKTIKSKNFVLADHTQIHQIIMNLCTNAMHAMEKNGGLLTIELSDTIYPEIPVSHRNKLTGYDFIHLRISDTGHGIPEKTRERIFDPYFTTKEQGKGTGLGLAITHTTIQQYNGTIIVNSIENKGTSFDIYLPAIEQEIVDDKEKENKNVAVSSARILFIDDEIQIAKMNKKILTKRGYFVQEFTSSIDAFSHFKENMDEYDIIITDQTMPNLTGLDLAHKIREINQSVPIILCSGFCQEFEAKIEKNSPIQEILTKPFKQNQLISAIEKNLKQQ